MPGGPRPGQQRSMLAFGIIRDELPPERVGMGLGLLSATFGVGGGAGPGAVRRDPGEPAVDVALLDRRRAADRHRDDARAGGLLDELAAVLAGFAMFGTFLLVPAFVQAGTGLPAGVAGLVDYGFGASVIVAGPYPLPASAIMLVVRTIGSTSGGRPSGSGRS